MYGQEETTSEKIRAQYLSDVEQLIRFIHPLYPVV